MLVDRVLWLGVGSPSLDSTRTISYCPASLDSTVGSRNDVSYVSSGPGSIVDVTDGVYSNKLELIDCCELDAYETSETGLERGLRVELGGGTGGMRKDAGVFIEVVTLLRDLEDVDMGVGDGEAVTLDAAVVVGDDTEDTVVDFGW